MAYSVPMSGSGEDFPRVPTGEYAFTIDELRIVRFDGDDHDKVSVYFNLGEQRTTDGETKEVRLRKAYKPSAFTGNATLPPAGWALLCRAVGIDPAAACRDLEILLGKSAIVPVVRAHDEKGNEKNQIGAAMPLGSATAPIVAELRGVTDKRLATTATDPNW